jgi:uncharacterized protein
MALLALLGVTAGALTTISGFGGGLMLVLVLTFFHGPLAALVISTPALFIGNLHRMALYRREIAWATAVPLLTGVIPGSIVGALLAVRVPAAFLNAVMCAMTALALIRVLTGWSWSLPVRWLLPLGAAIGLLAATAGGAGLLLGPLLLSAGLSGSPYLATMSLTAVAMHGARMTAYTASGLFTVDNLLGAALLAIALIAGNLLGDLARRRMSAPSLRIAEYLAPVACALMALAGLS